ncbi:MAG: hypothetical protein ABL949_17165 [Fimbriimonadaceae bacterium]
MARTNRRNLITEFANANGLTYAKLIDEYIQSLADAIEGSHSSRAEAGQAFLTYKGCK